LSPVEWEVYLDDVKEMTEVEDPDTGEITEKELEGCKAFEVNEETPIDASIFILKSVLLPVKLKIGQFARKGEFDSAVYTLLRKSMKGWKKVTNGKGSELEFSQKSIDFLPMEEATALAVFIMEKVSGSSKTSEEGRNLGND
jgi:hypothetical protein